MSGRVSLESNQPKADSVSPPPIPSVKLPTVPKLALYSAVPPQPLMAQFDAGFIAKPSSRPELHHAWEGANRAYNAVNEPSRSFVSPDDLRELEGVKEGEIRATLARVRLYAPFESHPSQLLAVRVDKIVTPQLSVSLPRANRRAQIPRGATDLELFHVSFSPSGLPEPIHHQVLGRGPNGGAAAFTSYDEDVRPHDPVFRDLKLEERDPMSQILPSLGIPVGGGIPFIMGHRIELAGGIERVVITNGIHRAYRAAAAGCEWLPLALCSLSPIELPPQLVELPSQLIANPGSNPPVLTDYLNEDVVMRLEYFPVLKVVRVNWGVEQYATVLR